MKATTIYQFIALFSTATTAVEIAHSFSQRKKGLDPSSQEDSFIIHSYLMTASQELEKIASYFEKFAVSTLTQQTSLPDNIVWASDFSHLLLLNRTIRILNIAHQRLLSLYPEVSEELIEKVRLHHAQTNHFVEKLEDFYPQLHSWLRNLWELIEAFQKHALDPS